MIIAGIGRNVKRFVWCSVDATIRERDRLRGRVSGNKGDLDTGLNSTPGCSAFACSFVFVCFRF